MRNAGDDERIEGEGETLRIALAMGLNDSYEHGIVRGVMRYAREYGGWSLHGAGWMFPGVPSLADWKGDGVIGRVESEEDALLLAKSGLPAVDVAGAYSLPGVLRVTNDDYLTGRSAAEHLLEAGFIRFAFCGVDGALWSKERHAGFVDAIEARSRARGARSQCPLFSAPLRWWESLSEGDELARWLSSLPFPTALFACNDTAAVKITTLTKAIGIRVPEELAVLGVDDEDILCELSDPPLSSIPLDCERIGYLAARSLDSLLRRPSDAGQAGHTIAPRPVVERASTRTFASDDPVVRRAARFIRAEAGKGISVRDVAAAAGVSRRTLELRFRSGLDRSVHEELVRARLRAAAALLRETNLPIRVIAPRCGIATLQRFYSLFRAAYGCTPARYRAQQRVSFERIPPRE